MVVQRWIFLTMMLLSMAPLTQGVVKGDAGAELCRAAFGHSSSGSALAPLLSSWIVAVVSFDKPDAFVLVDSGSAMTVCPPDHAPHIAMVKGDPVPMVGAGAEHSV